MVFPISGETDRVVTLARNEYEAKTKKIISKKDFIIKLVYENDGLKNLLETNGIKINKKIYKLPKI